MERRCFEPALIETFELRAGLLLTIWWPVSRVQDSQVTVPGPWSSIGWRREFPYTARMSVFNSWILSPGLTCPVFSAWYGTAKR